MRRAQPSGLSLFDVVARLVRRPGTGWARRVLGCSHRGAPSLERHCMLVVRARRASTSAHRAALGPTPHPADGAKASEALPELAGGR